MADTGSDNQVDAGRRPLDQRSHWDRVAHRWGAWRALMDRATAPVTECMALRAAIGPGSRVLDVATGYGQPALSVAPRVLPGGHVVALDLSREMLNLARGLALEAGVRNLHLACMDGTCPALRPAVFDAVLVRWGLMAFGDRVAGLSALRALLATGGETGRGGVGRAGTGAGHRPADDRRA
ncbi:MAG: class I SAM-dependent methyltransferase [Leptospirillia bacterium]